jgi:polysaccharide export outer membrane protein
MRLCIAIVIFGTLCVAAIAQEASYTLQVGDTIEVSVLQDPTLNRKIVIGPDGNISFPLAGHIRASGLTAEVLEKTLAKKLSKNYQTPPQVTVMLSGTNVNSESKIYVTGEVNKPGPYPMSPGTSVMQAIALSGGLGRFAATSRIQIHRRGGGKDQVFVFDYDAFESGKNLEGDIPLEPGDVIVVPEKGLFR